MWWDYVESSSPTTFPRAQLDDFEIRIIPTNVETSSALTSPSGRPCERCGRWVTESDERHEARVGHMSLVAPRLYLGAAWNAADLDALIHCRVGTVVSMAAELSRKLFPNTLKYKCFPLEDDEREWALPTLLHAALFLRSTLDNKRASPSISAGGLDIADSAVLVHCQMGRSRSVAAIIAFLMLARGQTFESALAEVQRVHHVARPNAGYRNQLLMLEVLLKHLPLPALLPTVDCLCFLDL